MVRQHALVHGAGEGAQDVPRFCQAAGREAEAGERDHGVAPPVGEPGVTGEDVGEVLAAANDEGVRREHQGAHEVRGFCERCKQRLAPAPFGGEQAVSLAAAGRAGRDQHAEACARAELQHERAWGEEVFAEVEPPLPLAVELDVEVPVRRRLEATAWHQEVDHGFTLAWPQGELATGEGAFVPGGGPGPSQAVEVPAGVERP